MTSGRPAFQQHTKRTEGSDTTHASHTQKALSAGHTSRNFDRNGKDHAAQRGRDASGQRRASCASLSRRLSAFFGSTLDRDPKGAKYAVLIPGPGMFVNVQLVSRVMIPPPIRNAPLFRRVCPCVRSFLSKGKCVPTFACESERGAFVREVEMRKKTDLRSECADNFWTIFAGTVLGEKSNFTGKFFEWRRLFDKSTR